MEEKKMDNMVSVEMDLFCDLMYHESQLAILRTAYQTVNRYAVENVLDAIFGIENKYKGDSGE